MIGLFFCSCGCIWSSHCITRDFDEMRLEINCLKMWREEVCDLKGKIYELKCLVESHQKEILSLEKNYELNHRLIDRLMDRN